MKKMLSDVEHETAEVDQRLSDSGRLVYTSVSVPSLVLRNLVANPITATSAHESPLVAGSKREYIHVYGNHFGV